MVSSLECLALIPNSIISSITLKILPHECHKKGRPVCRIRSITQRYWGITWSLMVAGATRTGNAVANMIRFWFGPDGFGPVLDKLKRGEL